MSESENESLDFPVALEALLFVSPNPVLPSHLADVLDISVATVESELQKLETALRGRGLRLQRFGGRVQLTTSPNLAEHIEHLIGLEATSRLSRAALETLAIVAYKQPVTRPYVEGVRGVSSDGVMKSLLGKGLVQEMGRAEGPGRPILYGTTSDFLQYFGLDSLSDLPPLRLLETMPENEHDEMLKG
jgi:segregation and condensation protein B